MDFDIDLPISGGAGSSRDDAIVIQRATPNNYLGVQSAVLNCMGIGRGIEWKMLQQATLDHEGRTLDQIKIETTKYTATAIITQVENYYFDISECLGV